MIFTKQQAEEFDRDGVAKLGSLLSQAELDGLRQHMEKLLFDSSGRVTSQVFDLSEKRNKAKDYSVMLRVNMHAEDDIFNALIRRDDILDMVEQVLGSNIQLFVDQIVYKPGGHGGELHLHQDNGAWKLTPSQAVTVWIGLDDATVENGCVHFIVGSHKWGLIEHLPASKRQVAGIIGSALTRQVI